MRRTLWKVLIILSILSISVGSTVAYLTDVDQDVNVMTLDRVEIDLIEQERNAAGTLVDFQDNHPLYPGVYPDGIVMGADNYFDDTSVRNAIDKIVTVKNTGKAPAYIRLWFAFEVTEEDNFFKKKIHLNRNTTDWQWEFLTNTDGSYTLLKQDGFYYVVATATYPKELASGATTPVSLRQVLLDSSATNDDFLALGDKYSIFVVAQGVQTAGFDNAVQALNESFGVPSMKNHPFAGMTGDEEEPVTPPDGKIYGAAKLDDVPVMSSNGANGYELFTIDKGYTFEIKNTITEDGVATWHMVWCDHPETGDTWQGYIWAQYVTIPDGDESDEEIVIALGVIQNTNGVNFRKEADINSVSMGMLKAGVIVEILEIPEAIGTQYWFKVRYDGKIGYIQSPYIQILPSDEPDDSIEDDPTLPASPASDFKWEKLDDGSGIMITQYIGDDETVVIPDVIDGIPVIKLSDVAFSYCTSLKTVYIPKNISSIGTQTFWECRNLISLQIDSSNPSYTVVDEVLYTKDMKSLIWCPYGKTDTLTIPEGVETIENYAVDGCWELREVIFPESLQVIEPWAFSNCTSLKSVVIPGKNTLIEIGAFSYCTNLSAIQVIADNQYHTSVDGVLFTKDMKTLITCPSAKEGIYTIPDGVTKIEEYAFAYCSGLTALNIPSSVTTIVYCAFDGCSKLQTISIPNTITELPSSLFMNCSGLTSITIPPSVISIDDATFWGSPISTMTVYCEENSYAHNYCIQNDIHFEFVNFDESNV